MKAFKLLVVAALSIGLAACASYKMDGALPKAVTLKDGHFANKDGMTLYTFDKDQSGKSVCNAECAVAWPPLTAAAEAKDLGAFTVIIRDDGARQWAHMGKPLYTFAKDKAAGETSGDGVKGVWHTAKP
jgi:predicted lipoprotein with Yx(FWY)xxD motif